MSAAEQAGPGNLAEQVMALPELAEAWRDVALESGEVLFRRGDPGDAFYQVTEGEVEIFAEDGERSISLERLGPGQHFGEVALLDSGGRAAGARAVGASQLRMLRREDFMAALPASPALMEITLDMLNTRLRRSATYLDHMTTWSSQVASGDYDGARSAIDAVAAEDADPNIARFASTFNAMIADVQAREDELAREVKALKIQIDRRKYDAQLSEVTETDFFRSLQEGAADMRKRIRGED